MVRAARGTRVIPAGTEFTFPREYDDAWIFMDGERTQVPHFSDWEERGRCCCGGCRLIYFPKINAYFLNQWEVLPRYPVGIIFGITVMLVAGILAVREFDDGPLRTALLYLFPIVYAVWICMYLMAVCHSPGYVPWYWSVEKRSSWTFEEQMDGVIVDEEQYAFAWAHGRPDRGSLSRLARRIVLKADHVCPWIANWVGLKNYRYFYGQVLWFVALFAVWHVIFISRCVFWGMDGWKTSVGGIAVLICELPAFVFFGFTCKLLFQHGYYLCFNTGTLQRMKLKDAEDKHNYYDVGCWDNCSQVCGPWFCIPCWAFPLPYTRIWDGLNWKTNRPREGDANVLMPTAASTPPNAAF